MGPYPSPTGWNQVNMESMALISTDSRLWDVQRNPMTCHCSSGMFQVVLWLVVLVGSFLELCYPDGTFSGSPGTSENDAELLTLKFKDCKLGMRSSQDPLGHA